MQMGMLQESMTLPPFYSLEQQLSAQLGSSIWSNLLNSEA
jgi:hypothetical protein